MTQQDFQRYNRTIIKQIWGAVFGGGITIAIAIFYGAMSVRDTVIKHEVRITNVENDIKDIKSTFITQNIKNNETNTPIRH